MAIPRTLLARLGSTHRTSRWLSSAFHRYRQHARGLTLGARALVLRERAGRVEAFFIRHTYAPGLQLPGGGIEPGEGAVEALMRELWEEGRIRPSEPPTLFGLYHNGPDWPRDHVALYVLRRFEQPEPPRPDAEIAEHLWLDVEALPPDVLVSARARIGEVVRGAPISETWVPRSGALSVP